MFPPPKKKKNRAFEIRKIAVLMCHKRQENKVRDRDKQVLKNPDNIAFV